MIAFNSSSRDYYRAPKAQIPNDSSLNISLSSNTSTQIPTLHSQLKNASVTKLSEIINAVYDIHNENAVETFFRECRSLWRESENKASSFSARSFRAAALILNEQADPQETPDPPKLAFINVWISAMQETFLLEESHLPSVTAIHQTSSSLLEVAIKLGESLPRAVFNASYCKILERLRVNLFLSHEIEYSAPELHQKLADYILDQIEVTRALSLRKLTLLPIFFGLALELKDPELTPYVAESTDRILKLFSWATKAEQSYQYFDKLKDHQQSKIFKDMLYEVLEGSLDILRTLQVQGLEPRDQDCRASIWQRALRTLPLGSIPWRTSIHGLIESAPTQSAPWVNKVVQDILRSANSDNLMLLLDIASSVSGIGVLADVVSDRPSSEQKIVCDCVREMRAHLLRDKMIHLVTHDVTAAELARSLQALLGSIEDQ